MRNRRTGQTNQPNRFLAPPSEEGVHSHAQPLTYALSRIAVNLSRIILAALIFNLVVQAFIATPFAGIRSLVATILPPIVTTYFAFARQSRQPTPTSSPLPSFAFYIGSALLMILLLILTRYAVAYSYRTLPLGEFLLSSVLSFYIAISNRVSFKVLVSCAYGIISGVLIYILIYGLAV